MKTQEYDIRQFGLLRKRLNTILPESDKETLAKIEAILTGVSTSPVLPILPKKKKPTMAERVAKYM